MGRIHQFFVVFSIRSASQIVEHVVDVNGDGSVGAANLLLEVPVPYNNHNGGFLGFGALCDVWFACGALRCVVGILFHALAAFLVGVTWLADNSLVSFLPTLWVPGPDCMLYASFGDGGKCLCLLRFANDYLIC